MVSRSAALLTALFIAAGFPPLTPALDNGTIFPSLAVPRVNDYTLHIISPDLLELVRINTKPTGATTVPDSWDLVTSGDFNAPALTQFTVSVDDAYMPVTEVYFRRRPGYVPLKPRDLRIDNRLFLKLASPVPEGALVEVSNPGGALWPSDMNFTCVATPTRPTEVIHVNQEGYTAADPKIAMVGYYLGSGGELNVAPGTAFTLVDAATAAVVHTGALTARPDVGFTVVPKPYQKVLEADFSGFTTPGEYCLQVPGLGSSLPFLISPSMAMTFARVYTLGLYNQRCGTAHCLPYTRHTHGACHTAPASIPYPQASFASSWTNIISANSDSSNNTRHTAPRLESEATQLYPFVRTGTVDVSLGHHDAGDYSKYTINSAQLVHSLTFAADSLPGAGALDNLGIPESGDGKSDLLQEAKYEADFLAKMQDEDGGFYFLVYPKTRKYEDNVLPDAGDAQVVWPKNTSATATATAALAELGSSPRFKAQYPAEAAAYLAKAQAGWQFLLNAIAAHGRDGSYQKLTHYGDVFMHDDELAWAASAIFVATGDANAHSKLMEWYDPSNRDTRRWTWWRLYEGYGCAARSYAFAVSSGRLTSSQADAAYLAKCRAEVLAGGEDALRRSNENAYGTAFDSESKRFKTAGWYFSLDRAFDMAVADQIQTKPGYLKAVIGNMNFEAGCNPVNVSFITGAGQKPQREIVSQYAQNDRRTLPPSGIPVGNLQSGFQWLSSYTTELGAMIFPSDGATVGPYPLYDRWGDAFNTSTEEVITNQGRGLATVAWLAARTPAATQAWNSAPATISVPGTFLQAGVPVEVVLSAPGLDLSGARVVWEVLGLEPKAADATYSFTPTTAGMQWIEAEAWLPDGRRVVAANSYYTSLADGGAPFTPDAETVALYHFEPTAGNAAGLEDSSGNGYTLTKNGAAAISATNTGWMNEPSGNVMRFSAVGDFLTVSIPDSALLPGSAAAAPLSVEAWFYPRAWKGYGVGNSQIVSLFQNYDSLLELKDGIWNSPKSPTVYGGNYNLMTASQTSAAISLNHWHLLKLTLYPDRTVKCFIDGNPVASVMASGFSVGRTMPWILTLGNFDGDLDEVRISRALRD